MDEVAEALREALEDALRGKGGWRDTYATLLQPPRHPLALREGPCSTSVSRILRRALRELGLLCRLYCRRDDAAGPAYLADCLYGGTPVAVALEVDIDPETGDVNLVGVYARAESRWPRHLLARYRPLE
ncbi:MAG: hypothetical protein QXT79_06995 [Thermofilaceae archaeon]